jgi:hypothetical protein
VLGEDRLVEAKHQGHVVDRMVKLVQRFLIAGGVTQLAGRGGQLPPQLRERVALYVYPRERTARQVHNRDVAVTRQYPRLLMLHQTMIAAHDRAVGWLVRSAAASARARRACSRSSALQAHSGCPHRHHHHRDHRRRSPRQRLLDRHLALRATASGITRCRGPASPPNVAAMNGLRFTAAAVLVASLLVNPPPAAAARAGVPTPAFVYGVSGLADDGLIQLHCYRHNGYLTGTPAWQYGVRLQRNILFEPMFSGGGTIYSVDGASGVLYQYRHDDFNTCGPLLAFAVHTSAWWQQRMREDTFFSMASSVPGVGVPIYAIGEDGDLYWYYHACVATGGNELDPGCWSGGWSVGIGWGGFKQVIPGGDGVIYALTVEGRLLWYRHIGYLTGGGLEEGAWVGGHEVHPGFGIYRQIVSVKDGIIYGVRAYTGQLDWWRHHGWAQGTPSAVPGSWEGPYPIGTGWNSFDRIFLRSPSAPSML